MDFQTAFKRCPLKYMLTDERGRGNEDLKITALKQETSASDRPYGGGKV